MTSFNFKTIQCKCKVNDSQPEEEEEISGCEWKSRVACRYPCPPTDRQCMLFLFLFIGSWCFYTVVVLLIPYIVSSTSFTIIFGYSYITSSFKKKNILLEINYQRKCQPGYHHSLPTGFIEKKSRLSHCHCVPLNKP